MIAKASISANPRKSVGKALKDLLVKKPVWAPVVEGASKSVEAFVVVQNKLYVVLVTMMATLDATKM